MNIFYFFWIAKNIVFYLIDDIVEIEDVVLEALVDPPGADIRVGEHLLVPIGGRVLDNRIQKSELLENLCSKHIVTMTRHHNYTTKTT